MAAESLKARTSSPIEGLHDGAMHVGCARMLFLSCVSSWRVHNGAGSRVLSREEMVPCHEQSQSVSRIKT